MPEPDPQEKEKKVLVEYLPHRSTKRGEVEVLETHLESHKPSWMDPVLAYLKDGALLVGKKEARRIQYQAANYTLIDGTLYKRGHSLPLLRYVQPEEGKRVLDELHAGVCGNHVRSQALHVRALRLGYYWPMMRGDAKELI